MSLLTLDHVSLAFGHLPLVENADLRIEPGERICLIGRNGTGKSSLLRVIAGEMPPDGGTIWRAPGLRTARLDQEVPGDPGPDRLRRSVGRARRARRRWLPITTTRRWMPRRAGRARAARRAAASARGAGRLAARTESRVDRLAARSAGRAADGRAVGRLASSRAARQGAGLVARPAAARRADQSPRHRRDPLARGSHLRDYGGTLLFVTHDRAFLDALATRIIELDRGRLTSWPGNYATYLERKASALDNEARDLERLDKKLAQEEAWLRQGVKARRTRNEGRVKALMALREERASQRARIGQVRMAIDASQSSGKLVFEAEDVSKAIRRRAGDPALLAAHPARRPGRPDRPERLGQDDAAAAAGRRARTGSGHDRGRTAPGSPTTISSASSSIPTARSPTSSATATTPWSINGQPRHIIGYLADFLFPRERAMSPVRALSGGERNRLLLARLFARPANVLVLDEPTNDLDIETWSCSRSWSATSRARSSWSATIASSSTTS